MRLFWLQTTSENVFPLKWVFGCYWKLGQTENVFSVDYKIRAMGRKIFSVVIFTSNHFRRCAKRERERERRTHRHANRERERERKRSRRRTHDRAGQIAVLVPSTQRWVLCSSHSGKRRPIPLRWPILDRHRPSERPTSPTHSSSSHSTVCFDLSLT